ncbi:MAG: trypsin-like peptidase domain-containing protein [Gemmatimonadales bacterium]
MSTHSRNWLKFGALVALAFVLGLFFAGLLNFPRNGLAQENRSGSHAPIIKVDAPHIPAAKPLADLSDAYAAVAEAVRPSVVFIQSEREEAPQSITAPKNIPPGFEKYFHQPDENPVDRSSGSGFVVSSDGYILTNNHVVEGATKVRVRLLDGRSFIARIIGTDKDTDIGVLKIEATGLTPAALGESDKVRVGEWVLAIGNPLGEDLTFSVTQGIVSAKGRGTLRLNEPGTPQRRGEIQDFIQTDAAINKGNSGGPLMNVRGEVIGINSAIASFTGFYSGYAFAVPIDLARKVMTQIIAHGKVVRAGLDVIVETADGEDAEYLGLDSIAGVKISDFGSDKSPAKAAGLEQGDVIIAIDGLPVKYVAQLQQIVGFKEPGTTVRVEAVRKSGHKEFTVRLNSVNVATDGDNDTTVAVAKPAAPGGNIFKNRLGVAVEVLTPGLASQIQVPTTTKGLMVRGVMPGSPAEDKLVPAGTPQAWTDVITEVEGKPVRSEAELRTALGDAKNNIVTLTIMNGGTRPYTRVVRVRLSDK